MMHSDTITTPPTQPVAPMPVRYWWLKRILLISLLTFVGLIGLHVWWSGYAERRFAQVIADAQAKGEPILPEDFNPPEVPTENNAALLYLKAAALVHDSKELQQLVNRPSGLIVVSAEDADAIAEVMAEHQEVFRLLREARSMDYIVWPTEVSSPMLKALLPETGDLRTCAKLLTLRSTVERLHGSPHESIATIQDVLALSNGVASGITLIEHLVSLAVQWHAVESLEAVLPALDDVNAAARGDSLRALRDGLLNEQPLAEGFVRSICMERAMQLDTLSALVSNGPATIELIGQRSSDRTRPLARMLAPLFRITGVRMGEYMACYVEAVGKPSWPDHLEHLRGGPNPQFDDGGLNGPTGALASILLPSLGRGCELHYRGLADRRLAAAALALRIFELETGRPAETLEEVVSAGYLPEVPRDPFTRDGRMRYAPEPARPIVYSVGKDGTDDGGVYLMDARGFVSRDSGDLVYFLDGGRPVEPPP